MKPYIIIGAIVAQVGRGEELLSILKSGHDMNNFPGCREYRIFYDSENKDKLWFFEVWDSAEEHKSSLNDPIIKAQIEKAMPIIASFADSHTLLET